MIQTAISGETQLRHFGHFLLAHDSMLQKLTAEDDRHNVYHNVGKPTTIKCGPVTVDVGRHEQLDLFQLVNSNNTILNKIICVFAQLCAEVRELRKHGDKLQLKFLFVDSKLCGENGEELKQPTLIVRISELLKFFCEIQYLVQRCVVVGSEILRQLASFFGGLFDIYFTFT